MPEFNKFVNIISFFLSILLIGAVISAIAVSYIFYRYSSDLPDYTQLSAYAPATVTRLYADDGKLLTEYAKEKRIFVPIEAIPKKVINAFISAEDKNFYTNPGIDIMSILRAAVKNVVHIGQNRSLVGGSTITQQVVKNFLLSNERTLSRKIKEAILSFRITEAYTKDKIMELYLNEIYLGNRSYGVAAAALNYFNKSLAELSIEEAATLASLPKAPSTLDPTRHPERARARRDWVIQRMEEDGYINEAEALIASAKPIIVASRDPDEIVQDADYFSEAVRVQLSEIYGAKTVFEDGLSVRTTIDPAMQEYAYKALHDGLLTYDKRHGWRGPIAKIDTGKSWQENLKQVQKPSALEDWQMAVVLKAKNSLASIGLEDGTKASIPVANMKWARKYLSANGLGPSIKKTSDVLNAGDVIAVSVVEENGKKIYSLEQIPEINGAIVAMEPGSGRVVAMVGGYHYSSSSQFNRALLAKRQPGSAFKPFVYLAALENGFKPNTIIVDEEIKIYQGPGLPEWNPQNYSGEYYGPSTLRTGVEKSRNAMTVRLSSLLGIDKVMEVSERFGINEHPARNFSICLGSAETTLLRLTNAYSILANGGKQINPSLIERIQDRNGKTLYKRDSRECEYCSITNIDDDNLPSPPILADNRPQLSDPISTYQIVSILEGVIARGTGGKAKSLGLTLAGKTGTTNDSLDTWFMGFSSNLVAGVFVGFDNPASLGKHETGASVALPIWIDFMKNAMKNRPDLPFRRPSGIKIVKIDHDTGQLPTPETPPENIIYEAFRTGTEPGASASEGLTEDTQTQQGTDNLSTGGVY